MKCCNKSPTTDFFIAFIVKIIKRIYYGLYGSLLLLLAMAKVNSLKSLVIVEEICLTNKIIKIEI